MIKSLNHSKSTFSSHPWSSSPGPFSSATVKPRRCSPWHPWHPAARCRSIRRRPRGAAGAAPAAGSDTPSRWRSRRRRWCWPWRGDGAMALESNGYFFWDLMRNAPCIVYIYIILYNIILYYITLYYIVLYCIIFIYLFMFSMYHDIFRSSQ